MRLYGVQGTQSVRADDEPETRPIIGEEGSTLRLTTTERRLKPRTSPESQPRLGFTGASKKFCPSSFFFHRRGQLRTEVTPRFLQPASEIIFFQGHSNFLCAPGPGPAGPGPKVLVYLLVPA